MVSGSSGRFCPHHGRMSCPICGSVLVVLEYRGYESEKLAVMKLSGFRCFLGCVRLDLHDKVVDGVSCRGKVFVVPIFDGNEHERKRVRQG